jgi:tetratricopeptide (TPR) repeat protein
MRLPTNRASLVSAVSIAGVLLLAAGLRVWHVLALRRLPLFASLMLDSRAYDEWAGRILAGDWLGGDSAFYMDPLYPYLLAGVYRCVGHDLLVVRLLQSALGVATCALAGLIGRRLGGAMVGTTAALLLAAYRPLVFEEGEIEKTALGVFLSTAALAFATHRSVASRLGAGICLGLAVLTRANLLLMAPLGALFFLWDVEPAEPGSGPVGLAGRWRERMTGRAGGGAAAFLLGLLLVLSPVLWRNHHVSGEWVLTTSQMGTNFYTGNNPSNSTGTFSPVPFVRPSPRHEEGDFRAKAEEITGRRMTPGEVSSFWFRQALGHVVQNPGFAAKVCLRKLALFWSDLEVQDGWSVYFLRRYSPALRAAPVSFGWLPPLALLGVMAAFRVQRPVRLFAGYVAAYCLTVVAFFVFSRYRVFAVPALAILAALGLRWAWDRLRSGDWRRAIPRALAALAVSLFCFAGASMLLGFSPDDFVMSYSQMAGLYEDRGDFRSAESLLREGLQQRPEAASLRCGLGSLYLRADRPQQALAQFARCLESDPYYLDGWFLLGQTHQALGQIEPARWCYRRQLAIQPEHRFAAICLAQLSSRGVSPRP